MTDNWIKPTANPLWRLLVEDARRCRAAQKKYFATRDHDALVAAKAAETALDHTLTKFDPAGNAMPTLFDKEIRKAT